MYYDNLIENNTIPFPYLYHPIILGDAVEDYTIANMEKIMYFY